MKMNHYLPLFIISLVLGISSCNKKIECQNGGVYDSVNETCLCEEGYDDIDCSNERREIFIGTFLVNLSGLDDHNPYTVIMTKSPDEILRVNINMDKAPFDGNFVGTMGESYLDIPLQTIDGETISGYIHWEPNLILNLEYQFHTHHGILIQQ